MADVTETLGGAEIVLAPTVEAATRPACVAEAVYRYIDCLQEPRMSRANPVNLASSSRDGES